jgi:hypothetical protein
LGLASYCQRKWVTASRRIRGLGYAEASRHRRAAPGPRTSGTWGTAGDNELEVSGRMAAMYLGRETAGMRFHTAGGHRFESCRANPKLAGQVRYNTGPVAGRPIGSALVRIANQRPRIRRRRPRGCFDGIRRASILADQHMPRVLSTGTATYTTTASPRTPRRTQAISPGELPRVNQAHAPGAINSMTLASFAAGGAGPFIGHHLAAPSAER